MAIKTKTKNLGQASRFFLHRIKLLIEKPLFIALTIFGNLVILTSAALLYYLEFGINPHIHSLLDTIWWSVSTVTTVGYGDIIPTTEKGRIVGIATMIIGTALFWSYTALFAEAMLTSEILDLEEELKNIEKSIGRIKGVDLQNKDSSLKLIENLEDQIKKLKKSFHDDPKA